MSPHSMGSWKKTTDQEQFKEQWVSLWKTLFLDAIRRAAFIRSRNRPNIGSNFENFLKTIRTIITFDVQSIFKLLILESNRTYLGNALGLRSLDTYLVFSRNWWKQSMSRIFRLHQTFPTENKLYRSIFVYDRSYSPSSLEKWWVLRNSFCYQILGVTSNTSIALRTPELFIQP